MNEFDNDSEVDLFNLIRTAFRHPLSLYVYRPHRYHEVGDS